MNLTPFYESFEIYKTSLASIINHRSTIFKRLLIPLLVLLLVAWVWMDNTETQIASTLVVGLLVFVLYAYIAVTVHRVMILGEIYEKGRHIAYLEFKYIFYFIGMWLIAFPLYILVVGVPGIGNWLVLLVSIYIPSRLSLVLPMIAISRKVSFVESWRLTKNHQILMIVCVGLSSFIVSLPAWFLSLSPTTVVFLWAYEMFSLVLVVACLSNAYLHIVGNDMRGDSLAV